MSSKKFPNLKPCELCGKNSKLTDAIIEGAMLSVCSNCVRFGKVVLVQKIEPARKVPRKIELEEESEIITENYSQLIKKARESMEIRQKELAKKISEKESVIHKLESGSMKPTISLARKLEKFLSIKLIEIYKAQEKKQLDLSNPGLTIGDLLKLKK